MKNGPVENDRALKIALLADAGHVNCQRWCEGLAKAGAEVHIISFRSYASSDMQIYQLPTRQLPGKLHYFVAVPAVRRLLATIQPDVLLAYYVTGYGVLGALSGFHPLVQVTSGSDVLIAPRNPVMKCLVRYSLGRADLVTTWAPHMAESARRLGVAEERLMVLPRGIPVGQFDRARCVLPQNNGIVRVICTRALKGEYNVDPLLRAMRLLQDGGVNLTLAGDGPEREKLIALTQKLGLQDKVRFAGFVPNDQLPGVLAQHDLYVSLVESDGVSASLLEAMAAGLFPIVPNHPANRFWIKPGENGLLLDDISPARVAEALTRAVSDLSLRRQGWVHNSEIVRKHADQHRNSKIFVQRFRELVRDHGNH